MLLFCLSFVSYTYEDERGIFPETQFIFDLEIPETFVPMNLDGEVQTFYLLSMEEVRINSYLSIFVVVGKLNV